MMLIYIFTPKPASKSHSFILLNKPFLLKNMIFLVLKNKPSYLKHYKALYILEILESNTETLIVKKKLVFCYFKRL